MDWRVPNGKTCNVFSFSSSPSSDQCVLTQYVKGAPIAGYILGAYGGTEAGLKAYRPAMFYAGSLALVSAVMIIAARLRINKAILGRG